MTLDPARVAALVLAAGMSQRFGDANKLLSAFDGRPVIHHVVETILKAGIEDIIVVTGHERDRIESTLARFPVRFVHNPDFKTGMAGSLKAGLRALSRNTQGAFVVLGDMPRVKPETLSTMIAALANAPGKSIAVPVFNERRSNPVLWLENFLPDLQNVTGDKGGRAIIKDNPEAVLEVRVEDPGVLFDIDAKAP